MTDEENNETEVGGDKGSIQKYFCLSRRGLSVNSAFVRVLKKNVDILDHLIFEL